MLKKVVRLWPCYAVSVTITWGILHVFELPGRMTTLKDYALNLLYINGFLGMPYVDGAHWYITTLLAGIFLVGIITRFRIENYPITYLGLLILEGVSKVCEFHILNKFLGSSYIGLMCLGVCIKKLELQNYNFSAITHYENLRMFLKQNKWFLTATTCAIYYVARKDMASLVCLCIALPVFIAVIHKRLPILEKLVPQHIGSISYPTYLIHQNIAYVLIYHFSERYSNYIIWWKLLAFVFVLLLGELLFWSVEQPIQKVIKKMTSIISPQNSAILLSLTAETAKKSQRP